MQTTSAIAAPIAAAGHATSAVAEVTGHRDELTPPRGKASSAIGELTVLRDDVICLPVRLTSAIARVTRQLDEAISATETMPVRGEQPTSANPAAIATQHPRTSAKNCLTVNARPGAFFLADMSGIHAETTG